MDIKIKYMSKPNWKRVTDREYTCKYIKEDNFKGVVSLMHIKEVTSPSLRNYKDKINVKIADKGFYWLQIGIEKANYWITAMYDENKNIVQYYIDITEKNVIKKDEDSYFYDLFLDIVLLNTGEVILLDEEELKQAYEDNDINDKQYELACTELKNIMNNIVKKKEQLYKFCDRYFKLLLKELKRDNK